MLVKVSPNELKGLSRLPFDVFSVNGDLVLLAGSPLGETEQAYLQKNKVYRSDEFIPIDHEGILYEISGGMTLAEKRELLAESAAAGIYDDVLSEEFLGSVREFWNGLVQGAPPDVALCEIITDKLVAEVTTKVDQVQYLSQIRVRDKYTYCHILDVTALSIALGIKLGMKGQELHDLALAAILHDLGKLMIPKSIMFKPTRLTEKEFEVMKLHPGLGHKIIKDKMRLPDHIARPALEHQEMWGGGGYPQNLTGHQIHPFSQVVKIADVYDALTSKRPYKEAIPSSKAVKIMLSEGDKSFNPELLAQFVDLSNYHEETRYNIAS